MAVFIRAYGSKMFHNGIEMNISHWKSSGSPAVFQSIFLRLLPNEYDPCVFLQLAPFTMPPLTTTSFQTATTRMSLKAHTCQLVSPLLSVNALAEKGNCAAVSVSLAGFPSHALLDRNSSSGLGTTDRWEIIMTISVRPHCTSVVSAEEMSFGHRVKSQM